MAIAVMVAGQGMKLVGDCEGVVRRGRTGPQSEAKLAREFYGGVWRRAWMGPASRDVLKDMRKVKAHQSVEAIADAHQREEARGNSIADTEAKEAVQEHPRWVRAEDTVTNLLVADAVVVARLIATAISRWPRAPKMERQPMGVGDDRRSVQRKRRAEAQQLRQVEQARRWATHRWQCWRGVIRCSSCLQRRRAKMGACPVETQQQAHPLLKLAEEARALGHELWALAALEGRGETPIAICKSCGGWSRWMSHNSVKLRRPCVRATQKGREAWQRVCNGRHPHTCARGATVALAPWPGEDE